MAHVATRPRLVKKANENTGVLEWWSNGVMHLKPNTPVLQHSIFFFILRASTGIDKAINRR
jgi:hypothetical protein